MGGFRWGEGVSGVVTPPPQKWSETQYRIHCTAGVPSHAGALVYIAKSLVVVVVSSKLPVVQPEVFLMLECLLEHGTI